MLFNISLCLDLFFNECSRNYTYLTFYNLLRINTSSRVYKSYYNVSDFILPLCDIIVCLC